MMKIAKALETPPSKIMRLLEQQIMERKPEV
jgi:hypothetical protein